MSPDTRACPVCWNDFTVDPNNAGRHTYCSGRCRAEAGRRRRKNTTNPPSEPATTPSPALPQPAATRDCPHCGHAITIVALLTTPEVARPATPMAANGVIPLRRT